jgi:hypothetical protein
MASWLGPPVEKYDYGTNGGSWTRQPALICIHSTEGTGWTNYQDGAVAPHFTIEPKTGEVHQHISMGHAARALAHPSGTPETNRAGVIQIEVIGTCDPVHKGDSRWNYLPSMSDAQAEHIRDLLDRIVDAIPKIPLTTPAKFEPYPEPSYGSNYPRMSTSTFAKAVGVIGHQHVPSNSHGDPGDIPISKILGDPAPPPRGQATMFSCQVKGQSAKWVSDSQTRRWIPDTAAWNALVNAKCISNSPLLATSDQMLTDCAGPVAPGTELPPGYTATQAGWIDEEDDEGDVDVAEAEEPSE